MNISSLLNPIPDQCPPPGPSVNSLSASQQATKSAPSQPKPKSSKMQSSLAPRFDKRETKGNVHFPVHETSSSITLSQMSRFNIYPQAETGSIDEFPRSIPYSSDKRTFSAGTGRDGFQVFQYTFNYSHKEDLDERRTFTSKDPEWHVLWDYNVGFVRMTPFFKAYDFPKTQPAKVIDQNPGLRELSHSITGGALVAQGYWLPFHAARAIAAAFCWKIRYALVPMFGVSFVNDCIHPDDPAFNRWTIDPAIIHQARATLIPQKQDHKTSGKLNNSHVDSQGRPLKQAKTSSPSPASLHKQLHMKLRPRDAIKTYAVDTSDAEDDASTMPNTSVAGKWMPVNRGRGDQTTKLANRSPSPLANSSAEISPLCSKHQGTLKRKRPASEEFEDNVTREHKTKADGHPNGKRMLNATLAHKPLTWESATDLERDAVLGLLKLKSVGGGWTLKERLETADQE